MMLNELQKDGLREYLNISIGKAANLLSEMTAQRIELSIPDIDLVSVDKVKNDKSSLPDFLNGHIVSSTLTFGQESSGKASLVFPVDDAKTLIDLFMGEDDFTESDIEERNFTDTDFDAMREIGNIMLNALIGGLGNLLDIKFEYELPKVEVVSFPEEDNNIDLMDDGYLLIIQSLFDLKEVKVKGSVVIVLSMDSVSFLKDKIDEKVAEFYDGG